jgi:hypothetical protein
MTEKPVKDCTTEELASLKHFAEGVLETKRLARCEGDEVEQSKKKGAFPTDTNIKDLPLHHIRDCWCNFIKRCWLSVRGFDRFGILMHDVLLPEDMKQELRKRNLSIAAFIFKHTATTLSHALAGYLFNDKTIYHRNSPDRFLFSLPLWSSKFFSCNTTNFVYNNSSILS